MFRTKSDSDFLETGERGTTLVSFFIPSLAYIQSEEDKQKEQQWKTLATVCEYIFAACILSLIILSILRKRQIRKAEQAELESEQQKELYR